MGNCVGRAQKVCADDDWRLVLDAETAMERYVADFTLHRFCSDDELEFRALLDECFAYSYFLGYAAPPEKNILKSWKDLFRLKGDFDIIKVKRELMKPVHNIPNLSLFFADINAASNSRPREQVQQYEAIRRHMMRWCFEHSYKYIYTFVMRQIKCPRMTFPSLTLWVKVDLVWFYIV